MSNDIVARLRNCNCIPHCLCAEAADEIELLRRQVCRMSDERTEMLTEHGKIVKTLMAERDEARREVCAMSFDDQRRTAEERGWDCFKEER
jgi:hypothetical protein